MKKSFTIGEIASLHNIAESTLRYYDQKGIFQPKTVDSVTSYRYYTIDQFPVLEMIKFLRHLDTPLSSIKKFLENRTPDTTYSLLQKQMEALEQKKREIEYMSMMIKKELESMEQGIDKTNQLVFYKRIPQRYVLSISLNDYITDDEFIMHLTELQKRLHSRAPALITSKIGTSISKHGLLSGNYLNYSGLFITVDQDMMNAENFTIIPEGLYACTYHYGDYDDNQKTYDGLLDQIQKDGYQISGDSIEIGIIDYSVTPNSEDLVTEYQIPIKKI